MSVGSRMAFQPSAFARYQAWGLIQRCMMATSRLDMPALSPTMQEGKIVKWHIQPGDAVSVGDVIYEIETDKATMEVEASDDGVLAKIMVQEGGDAVPIGTCVGLVVEEGEDINDVEIPDDIGTPHAAGATPAADSAPAEAAAEQGSAETTHASTATSDKLGPAVRKLLEEYGLALTDITSSSHWSGRVLKEDVMAYIEKKGVKKLDVSEMGSHGVATTPAAPLPPAPAAAAKAKPVPTGPTGPPPQQTGDNPYVDLDVTNMRKVIAQRLTESKFTIPHAYMTKEMNLDNILSLREQMKENFGVKVSVNDFVIRSVAAALRLNPACNVLWDGQRALQQENIDVSVAVATDGGLITPIVFGADRMTVPEIGAAVKELAAKARANKLQPQEYQGGTFSVSNLGMYGVKEFTAVINPPQACIMAVGGSRVVPEPVHKPKGAATLEELDWALDDSSSGAVFDQSSVRLTESDIHMVTKMNVTVSFDSRAVDSNDARSFLETFARLMENPGLLSQF
eukprot:Clim_evm88s236 gene=Clim_evmTU88s236